MIEGGKHTEETKKRMSKSRIGKKHSEETKKKMSKVKKGKLSPKKGIPMSEDQKKKLSKSLKGRTPWNKGKKTGQKTWNKGIPRTEETKKKIAESHTGRAAHNKGLSMSKDQKKKISATLQGIEYDEWEVFMCESKYCPRFNDRIRQYIRDKYNNCDYMSGLPATVCNNKRKLDIHHIDYNKQQGCEEHEWRLIPLSQSNHSKTQRNRSFWNRLFTYALQYDETYYPVNGIGAQMCISSVFESKSKK